MNTHVLISTFESIALLLSMGVLGLWITGKRILPKEALGVLSTLALDIALPSLVFVNILQNFKPSEFHDWWLLPLWWAGLTVLLGLLTALFSLVSGRAFRRELARPSGNPGCVRGDALNRAGRGNVVLKRREASGPGEVADASDRGQEAAGAAT